MLPVVFAQGFGIFAEAPRGSIGSSIGASGSLFKVSTEGNMATAAVSGAAHSCIAQLQVPAASGTNGSIWVTSVGFLKSVGLLMWMETDGKETWTKIDRED